MAQRAAFDSVCVLTIFSRSAYTVTNYGLNATDISMTEAVSALRKGEGMRFAAAIQAEAEACDLPEALLRGYDATSAATRLDDRLECRSRIQEAVRTMLARRRIDRLSFPLGAASHLDHKIVGDTLLEFTADTSGPLQDVEVLA